MNLQLLMAFAPFIALLYLAFALIQALRHQQQGIIAALLALLVIALPLAAYFLAGTILRARLINSLTLNAAIVFIGSLLILLIERGNRKRDPRRSYGMLGVGVSICLALITFGAPLLITTGSATPTAGDTAAAADTTLRNVAAVTRGAFSNTNAQATNPAPGAPQATAEPGSSEPTAVAQVLMAQTGLTSAELMTQVDAGSTIADLVKANNGDLDAVITAISSALDEMVAAGGRGGQLLERLGSDTTQDRHSVGQRRTRARGALPTAAVDRWRERCAAVRRTERRRNGLPGRRAGGTPGRDTRRRRRTMVATSPALVRCGDSSKQRRDHCHEQPQARQSDRSTAADGAKRRSRWR